MGTETISKQKPFAKVKQSKNQKKKMDFNTKIAPFMKVGFVISVILSLHDMWKEGYIADTLEFSYVNSKFFWTMIFILSISHIIYYIIWHFPEKYIQICSNPCIHPVDLTFAFVMIGKVVQFVTCLSWYFYINDFFLGENPEFPVSPAKLISGGFLICCGQWLNTAVWNTLGINGVCYGFKLGRSVPWITGFPFNIGVANPQYVGSVLTNFGIISILVNPVTAKAGILFACFLIAIFYGFSAYIETYTGIVQGKIE